MDEITKDSRFSHIVHDPRFRKIPKREKKVQIDKRFQSMFKDSRFTVNYTVDKRGRPVIQTSNEDLKRYYALSSDDDDDDDDDDGNDNDDDSDIDSESEGSSRNNINVPNRKSIKSGKGSNVKKEENVEENLTNKKPKFQKCKTNTEQQKKEENNILSLQTDKNEFSSEDDSEKEILSENVKEKLRNLTVDYARGEGVLFSESSSDEESLESDEDLELDHGWGELDRDAEHTDDITHRLAVCHMDWDRIRANDLMILFNSFLPQGGLIHSVTIYPSEYGRKRMKEEELKGPQELLESANPVQDDEEENVEENEEGSKYHMEKLRQYQLNRLKYYYAILVCDSPETANKIYTECDGLEYESSSTRLDLRFVPNDTTFEEDPREICDKLPDLTKYQPRYFTTTALQQAKVELTWDETNPERNEIAHKLMSGQVDGISEKDLHDYLASSSGEESNDDIEKEEPKTDEDSVDPVSKYRALLQGIEEQEEKKKFRDVEMEVSWGVGLKDKTERLVQKKLKEKKPELTPFEQYIEKRKEKRKQKKEEKKKKTEQTSETSDNAFSDDDIPSDIDLNDQYFKEEFDGEFKTNKKTNIKKNKKKLNVSEDEESKHEKAELELLLMNDDTAKNHFSLKAIQNQEAEEKKKRRKRKKKPTKEETKIEDDFEVNVKDERFSALFTSHHYNIDPTDAHYHKTKGIEALQAEKLLRRQNEVSKEDVLPAKIQKLNTSRSTDPELSSLVKSVKRKTQNLNKGIR